MADQDPPQGDHQPQAQPEPPRNDPPLVPPPPPPAEKRFTQAELDAIVQDRIARAKATNDKKLADYDALKKKAADFDNLQRERESETEKQIREAREQARQEALGELRPRLVATEFRAAAAGRIDAARLDTLTEDIDLSRYLLEDGSVDVAKVAAKVDAWAPPKTEPDPPKGPRPDPSQGARGTKVSGLDAGREMFAARRKKPASP